MVQKAKQQLSPFAKLGSILVLGAGVYVYGLPTLTVEQLAGSISLVTLIAACILWIK